VSELLKEATERANGILETARSSASEISDRAEADAQSHTSHALKSLALAKAQLETDCKTARE